MEKKNFFYNTLKAAACCLVATSMMMGFTACTDDLYDEPALDETQLDGMLGASADTYNINDGEFTAENWRQQDAIYIYDNEGPEIDGMGREGYTLVNLPWYDGDRLTNLPPVSVTTLHARTAGNWCSTAAAAAVSRTTTSLLFTTSIQACCISSISCPLASRAVTTMYGR